jgi:hypothetical protein
MPGSPHASGIAGICDASLLTANTSASDVHNLPEVTNTSCASALTQVKRRRLIACFRIAVFLKVICGYRFFKSPNYVSFLKY